MTEFDPALGLDAGGHDRAHNRAAVAVFGLTALAIIGGSIAWLGLRPSQPESQQDLPVKVDLALPSVAVPADAPMLRSSSDDDDNFPVGSITGGAPGGSTALATINLQHSVTLVDGRTGGHETVGVAPGMAGPDGNSVPIPR